MAEQPKLLGYDGYRGKTIPFPDAIVDAAPDWHDLTRDPRKYGFHATLKAPFTLAPGKTEADLVEAVAAFARQSRNIPVISPIINAIGDFIAIRRRSTFATLERDGIILNRF